MNDRTFPRLGEEPRPAKSRKRVARMALFHTFWSVLLGAFVGIGLYQIIRGEGGFIIMLTIGLVIGAMTTFQALQFLRDLRAEPVQVEGPVLRKWHKGNLLIVLFPSYYMMVEDKIYTISRHEYGSILENDIVRITCFPHSLTIERIELYDSLEKQFVPATGGPIG